ncbi:MAG TPA: hypothetical protein VGH07_07985, partial [Chthoniobacterales bacterium]
YQYQQALDRDPRDDQAKKNLRILEERIKQAQRQQQQQSQGQQKQQNRNKQQPGRSGRRPDQQSDPLSGDSSQPDDEQAPGSQHQDSSDRPDTGYDQTQEDAEPTPKKEGQLRELTQSGEGNDKLGQQNDSRANGISEDEARQLLNSLKNESDRIDLMHRKTDRPVLRDW